MKTLIRSEYSGIKFAKKLSKIGKSNSQSLLTERQIMVRTLLLQGFTIMEIAADMGVCVTTIKKEKARIDKLDPLPPISD
jgi:DNA-binding NarL/FixJ family response regulator